MEILPDNTPRERLITGEIVYIDDLRYFSSGEKVTPYNQLPPREQRVYEDRAREYIDSGEEPSILQLYEKYDTALNLTETEAVLRFYTEELFELGGKHSPMSYTDIIPWANADRSLELVMSGDIAGTLRPDDRQLAIEPTEYYSDIDVRKQDAVLTQTSVTAWHWTTAKTALLDPEDTEKPYDVLVYPQDESVFFNQLDLAFHYDHPTAGGITETISMLSTLSGRLELSSTVWLSTYAESGYEGHDRITINEPSDEQVAAFLTAVSGTVGDDPTPTRRFQ